MTELGFTEWFLAGILVALGLWFVVGGVFVVALAWVLFGPLGALLLLLFSFGVMAALVGGVAHWEKKRRDAREGLARFELV